MFWFGGTITTFFERKFTVFFSSSQEKERKSGTMTTFSLRIETRARPKQSSELVVLALALSYDLASVDDVDAGDFEDVDGSDVALLYRRNNDNMPAAVLSVGNDVTFVAALLHQLLQGRTVNAGYALKLCIGGGGVYLQFS